MSNYIATGDAASDPLTNPPTGLPPGTTVAPTSSFDFTTPMVILSVGGLLWALMGGGKKRRR